MPWRLSGYTVHERAAVSPGRKDSRRLAFAGRVCPVHAETAYIFRHALLRDAAYGLQPPGERGVLHGLALEILQALLAPEEIPALAMELAEHARLAMHDTLPDKRRRALLAAEHDYLNQAAEYLQAHWQSSDEVRVRDLLAVHPYADAREQRRHLYTAGERLEQ